jgi:hypothetical protein
MALPALLFEEITAVSERMNSGRDCCSSKRAKSANTIERGSIFIDAYDRWEVRTLYRFYPRRYQELAGCLLGSLLQDFHRSRVKEIGMQYEAPLVLNPVHNFYLQRSYRRSWEYPNREGERRSSERTSVANRKMPIKEGSERRIVPVLPP